MLVGQKYTEHAKKTYEYYLHHLYITEDIGKCIEFTYDKINLENTRNEVSVAYKIAPIHKKLNSIKNIQSINNLIPMMKIDIVKYDGNDKSFFKNATSFLQNLALNITE
jgi:transcription antitermination factor NusA-like protein